METRSGSDERVERALSPIEQGLLFHYVHEADGAYVDQMVCDIVGRLDVQRFEAALRRLSAVHASLRTTYVRGAGGAMKGVVRGDAGDCLRFVDLSAAADPPAAARARAAADATVGFDLARQTSRCTLYRVQEQLHVFAWTYHHVVADSWTLRLLQEQFCRVYRALLEGTASDGCRATPYSAYVEWIAEQDRVSSLRWWSDRLDRFASHRPAGRPGGRRGGTKSLHFALSSAARRQVDEIRRSRKVTTNVVLLAMWSVLALERQQSSTCLLGCVVFGRGIPLRGVDRVAGVCANTIPIVVDGAKTIQRLLAELQRDVLAANARSYLALSDVLGVAGLGPGDLHSVVNFTIDEPTVRNEHVAHLPFALTNLCYSQAATFDAYLDVEVRAEAVEVTIHYDPERRSFERDDVAETCERILQYIADHPGDAVRDALDALLVARRRFDAGFSFDCSTPERPAP